MSSTDLHAVLPLLLLSCRLGHNTAHFNVGNYRRMQKEANEVQDASFFDSHNQVRARQQQGSSGGGQQQVLAGSTW